MRKWHLLLLVALMAAGCMSGGGGGTTMVYTMVGGSTSGVADGPASVAKFNNPVNCAVAADGSIYICDFDNNRVRHLGLDQKVVTVVSQADFSRPFGIAFAAGVLYVQTDANDAGARDGTTGTVWRVDPVAKTATVVARNLGRPRGLVGLADGRLVLSNLTRNTIQVLDPTSGAVTPLAGQDGVAGFADGNGASALFDRPYGLTRLPDDSLLVADQNNNRIRRVTLSGDVTTYAGSGVAGYANGPVATAQFDHPQDVDCDPLGNVYVGDNGNHRFRVIASGKVAWVAGDGIAGFKDGSLAECRFFGMEGFAISEDFEYLYVADGTGGDDLQPYHRLRKICVE